MKIKTKLIFASAAILILLISLGSGCWLLFANQRSVLDEMSKRNQNEQKCTVFMSRIIDLHQNIYKAINWATMGYNEQRISELVKMVVDENRKVKADMIVFSESSDIDHNEAVMVRKVLDGFEVYSNWLLQVVDMCSVDPATSSMLMGSAENAYQEMKRSLDELAGYERERSIETRMHSDRFRKTISITFIMVFFAVTLAVAVVLIILIKSIIPPLQRITDLVKDISEGEGDLTKRIEVSRSDEIGEMADYFNKFVEKLQGMVRSVSANANTVASSATELLAVSAQSVESLQNMSERTSTVATAAEESSVNTMNVASSIKQASTNLYSVASATEEMSATIGEIASSSEKARAISVNASKQASAVSMLMQQLGDAAQDIGKVTETITDISSQTNLLALNATIEAARAGSAGKGFAVVANEIKELAKQTASATEDIKAKISGVQTSAGGAIADIEKITSVIGEVGHIISNIATAIEQQSTVTKDVAGNIAHASTGVQEANESIAQSASVSRSIAQDISNVDMIAAEIRSGGKQVETSAAALSKLAEQLKNLVTQFRV